MFFSLTKRYSFFVLLLLPAGSCRMLAPEQKIPGYDLAKPEKFVVPGTLIEISGIALYKGDPGAIYAIQDEQGKLFRLQWGVKKQYHVKFSKDGDFEDLAIMGDKAIVLKSNGKLYSFPLADTLNEEVANVKEWKGLIPEGEYESLYADEATNFVYVLCKNCAATDSKVTVPGYRLRFDGDSFAPADSFSINVAQIRAINGKVKRGFRPSALAKNPVTQEWYIISAVNQLLVVADSSWTVKNVYHLDGNRFNQPEGIAFDTKGNMYISNEGDHLNEGNILRFTRREN